MDEIHRRGEESMTHQQAILVRLDRCAEAGSNDSRLEEQVNALRDAQRKLLRKLVERFGLSQRIDSRRPTDRRPLPMCPN